MKLILLCFLLVSCGTRYPEYEPKAGDCLYFMDDTFNGYFLIKKMDFSNDSWILAQFDERLFLHGARLQALVNPSTTLRKSVCLPIKEIGENSLEYIEKVGITSDYKQLMELKGWNLKPITTVRFYQ